MASIRSLEDMPQLVLEKISSFLNHKELLALEQTSKTLKCAVDEYFRVTDQILIGYLRPLNQGETRSVDGLVKLIMRCGTRLRIIQINISHELLDDPGYETYFRRIFETVGNKCPNIESIITSPKPVKKERNIDVLRNYITDVYATQIYESTGKGCKLRSIKYFDDEKEKDQCERILNLYPKLEEMHFSFHDRENFRKFSSLLHRFIENGLKDLKITYQMIYPEMVLELSQNGKNLRTMFFHCVAVFEPEDVAIINKIEGLKNVSLELLTFTEAVSLFNEGVCKFIVRMYFLHWSENDELSSLVKMSNLEYFQIQEMKELKVISQGPFPKLTEICAANHLIKKEHLCDNSHVCAVQCSLHQLLVDKGNQLTNLKFENVCYLDALLVALKYCKAAMVIDIGNYENLGNATTYEDVLAIFDLLYLRNLRIRGTGDVFYPIYDFMKRAAKEKTHFKIEYKMYNPIRREILLTRIVI